MERGNSTIKDLDRNIQEAKEKLSHLKAMFTSYTESHSKMEKDFLEAQQQFNNKINFLRNVRELQEEKRLKLEPLLKKEEVEVLRLKIETSWTDFKEKTNEAYNEIIESYKEINAIKANKMLFDMAEEKVKNKTDTTAIWEAMTDAKEMDNNQENEFKSQWLEEQKLLEEMHKNYSDFSIKDSEGTPSEACADVKAPP